jgi:phage shock protein C
MEKKLYRDENRKMIAGVCAGLADYFGVDVTLIRLIFALTLIFKGGGLLLYLILWIVTPAKPLLFNNQATDFNMPAGSNPTPPYNPFPNIPSSNNSGAIIGGIILVTLGAFLLLDEFDIIPYFDFAKLWPLILIAVGVILLLKPNKNQAWEDWKNQPWDKKVDEVNTEKKDDSPPPNL